MIKVLETLGEPIRLIAKPGITFEPGMVVKLSYLKNGTLVCDIGDGALAIGIVDNFYAAKKRISYKNMVRIWTSRMIFLTTRYDINSKFIPGGAIYVKGGYLTSELPFEGAPYVARVTKVPVGNTEALECLWF